MHQLGHVPHTLQGQYWFYLGFEEGIENSHGVAPGSGAHMGGAQDCNDGHAVYNRSVQHHL